MWLKLLFRGKKVKIIKLGNFSLHSQIIVMKLYPKYLFVGIYIFIHKKLIDFLCVKVELIINKKLW